MLYLPFEGNFPPRDKTSDDQEVCDTFQKEIPFENCSISIPMFLFTLRKAEEGGAPSGERSMKMENEINPYII